MYKFTWLSSSDNLEKLFQIRLEVFCDKQDYPRELEIDEHDHTDAVHLLVTENDEPVGCARYVKITDDLYKIGRFAVKKSKRKTGLGRQIVEACFDKVKSLGCKEVVISAQTQAVGFYEKLGFVPYGIEYIDEHIPHVNMKRSFVFDNATWVEFEKDIDAALYRREFFVKNIANAHISICGLGYFELFFNGKKFNDDLFIPAQTDYEDYDITKLTYPIFDTISHRILYLEYDVTNALEDGENCIGVHVGNGWYGEHECRSEGYHGRVGDIKLIYKLTITDKDGETYEFVSGENDEWIRSFITRASIYFGENHDYRLLDNSWATVDYKGESFPCIPVNTPVSVLQKQNFDADKVIRTLKPLIHRKTENSIIYDIGENTSGYLVLKFNDTAKIGEVATAYYIEILDKNGKPDRRTVSKKSIDTFINGGNNELLYPHFTWHAGRFVEVKGDVSVVEFRVIHTPLETIAEFESSDETLNWIFDAYKRTQLANVHGNIPSDCPHRERLGYTGDGQLTIGAAMNVFDCRQMYKKWIRDILDCQDRTTGHIQHTAPFKGGGGGPGGWGGAVCVVPYRYYEFTGDKEVLSDCYLPMLKYIDFMESRMVDGLVMSELEGGWCLGDWCTPEKIQIPEPYVNTFYLIHCIDIMLKVSKILDKTHNNDRLLSLRQVCVNAMYKNYYDEDTGSFSNGIQGADAFAVQIGLGDERTFKTLLTKYIALGQFDTGIFGTFFLIKTLFENDAASLAYRLLTNKNGVSFFNMKKQGATTIWENWNGEASHNHPMFGAIVEFFISHILGITYTANGDFTVKPAYIPELKYATGSVKLGNKKVSVEIKHGKLISTKWSKI